MAAGRCHWFRTETEMGLLGHLGRRLLSCTSGKQKVIVAPSGTVTIYLSPVSADFN